MRVSEIKLHPLEGKYYSTVIELRLNGNDYNDEGTWARIEITAQGSKPSSRELEKGYYTDEGMDHVEPEEAYELATAITKMLLSYRT